MLGACVLDDEGRALGSLVDDLVPLRHIEAIVSAIMELSELSESQATGKRHPRA